MNVDSDNIVKQSLDILEELYEEFEDARLKYATSDLSLEYLEGRCDAIDIAIQRIGLNK